MKAWCNLHRLGIAACNHFQKRAVPCARPFLYAIEKTEKNDWFKIGTPIATAMMHV
jgi:hypothetical protein